MTSASVSAFTLKNVPVNVPKFAVAPHATSLALAPIFVAATANAARPDGPGTWIMPSLVGVAPTAITSVVTPGHANKANVFTPDVIGAAGVFAQTKLKLVSPLICA